MAFEKKQFEAAGGNWEMGSLCNRTLAEVAATRVAEVAHVENGRSTITGKFAVLRQALTYRTVDLVESAMSAWSSGSWLSSLITGRAAIETVALAHEIKHQMRKLIDGKDATGLNALAQRQLYAAKVKPYLLDPKFLAKTILSAVDRLNKEVPDVREYYDALSEFAHPNARGHRLFYGKFDQETGIDHFAADMTGAAGTVKHVTVACLAIIWAQLVVDEMDQMQKEIVAIEEAAGTK
jgi:hypothetical protein